MMRRYNLDEADAILHEVQEGGGMAREDVRASISRR